MKAIILVALLALTLCAEEYTKEDDVIVLTDDNFDAAVAKFDKLLVKFYAPWCGHCKKLAPEYSKAAAVLEKEGIILAQLDATVHKTAAGKFNISGYPTLKLFINGKDSEYNGGRTEKEIIAWMRKKTGPITTPLTTEEEFTKFIDAEVAVVYFGDNANDISEFETAARNTEDFSFATCAVADLFAKYNAKAGTVVLFKKFDEKRNDLTEAITSKAITDFISKHSTPKVMGFDDKAAQLIFGKNKPGIFLYRDKNSEKAAEYMTLMSGIADKLDGKLQVVVTDIKEGLESRLAEYIGIKADELPCVRIHDTTTDLKKYNMSGEINEANILAFIKDWQEGKLRPTLKSDEIPTEQKGPVRTLVGKSFQREVLENDKDVLVKFYAPWCGHCKQLAPIYEELATKLAHNTNLIIAEMDSTTNEIEGVSISGFPTIKFYPGNKKDQPPMDYSGNRDLEGFEKFLSEHCTSPIKLTKDEL